MPLRVDWQRSIGSAAVRRRRDIRSFSEHFGAALGRPAFAAASVAIIAAIVLAQWSRLSGSTIAIGNSPLWVAYPVAWPAFFCIAGLAFGAHAQISRKLAAARAAWDYGPPVVISVLVAACVLGPAVTTLSLPGYFTDADFWFYLANLAAWPRFPLPGVFQVNNVVPAVNGTLWTLPILSLTLLSATLAVSVRSRAWAVPTGVVVAACTVVALLNSASLSPLASAGFTPAEANGVPLSAAIAGQLGIVLALYADRIVRDWGVAGIALAALVAAAVFGDSSWNRSIPFCFLAAAATSYVAAFAATASRRLPGAEVIDRYSTAFLFYAFPSAQFVIGSGMAAASGLLQAVVAAAIAGSFSFLTSRSMGALAARLESPRARAAEGPLRSRLSLSYLKRRLREAVWPALLALLALSLILGILWMTLIAFRPESGGL